MSAGMSCRRCLATLVAAGLAFFACAACAQDHFLAKGGQAEAVIVAGQGRETFERWVAGELQRYLQKLSGAELSIVASDQVPPGKPLIVVGGPQSNPLAASAQEKQLVSFDGLKAEGFVLKSIELDGRPAVVAGGNDEAGTMYAAYELLERLGIVFQLTNDIIPEQKPNLVLPALDVRMEPVLKDRGMHCCHGIRWYMGLADFRQEIDQLAKLKMNVLQFSWGMDALVKAFLLLEENEKTLGWHGRHGLFGTYHHGNRMGVGLRSVNWTEEKLKIDRPEVEKAVQATEEERKFWDGRAAHCRQALELIEQARPKVLPGSREELDYVIYKTENFVTVFEELSAANEAKAAYDRAVLAMDDGKRDEVRKHLDQCQTALDRANRLVREAAEQMMPYANVPTEKHILYLFNDAMPSHEAARAYLDEVIAFCERAKPK